MRNQINNCPRNFPLLQTCLHIWQKLRQTTDTAGESQGSIIAAGHLVPHKYRNQFSTAAIRFFQAKFESVFSSHTQLQLLTVQS